MVGCCERVTATENADFPDSTARRVIMMTGMNLWFDGLPLLSVFKLDQSP